MNKALIALPLLLLAACSGPRSNDTSTQVNVQAAPDLVSVIEGEGRAERSFDWFGNALMQSAVRSRMQPGESYTVLAVRDSDLGAIGNNYFSSDFSPSQFETVIAFHVLRGRVTGRQLQRDTSFTTLSGQRLFVSNWGGDVEVYTRGADGSRTSSAKVLSTDVAFDLGLVHFIDQPLLPVTQTMGDMLREAGGFEYLLAAAQVTGASAILEQPGPFTLFAPTNEAFQAHLSGFDPNDTASMERMRSTLLQMLQRHLIPGRVYSGDFAIGSMTSVGGGNVPVQFKRREFRFAGQSLQRSDIETSNGVIHVVNGIFGSN